MPIFCPAGANRRNLFRLRLEPAFSPPIRSYNASLRKNICPNHSKRNTFCRSAIINLFEGLGPKQLHLIDEVGIFTWLPHFSCLKSRIGHIFLIIRAHHSYFSYFFTLRQLCINLAFDLLPAGLPLRSQTQFTRRISSNFKTKNSKL